MDIDWVLERRRPKLGILLPGKPPTTSCDFVQERLNSGIMIQTQLPLEPIEYVWVKSIGRHVQLKEVVTRSVIGAVMQGRSLAVILNQELPPARLYELVCVSCMLSINDYRYPQVAVVVKQGSHFQEASSFIQREYGYEKQPLDYLTPTPIVFCSDKRFHEMKMNMLTTTLVVLFGKFSEGELKKYKEFNSNLLAVLLDYKAFGSLESMFSCTVMKVPNRLFSQFESQYDLHSSNDIIGFEESELELFLLLLVLHRKKIDKIVIFTPRATLQRIRGFAKRNFPQVLVEDTDRITEFTIGGWHVLGYGARLPVLPSNCQRLMLLLKQNDLSLHSDLNISIQQSSNSYYDPTSFFHDSPLEKVLGDDRQPSPPKPQTVFSKKSQPPPVVLATELHLPLTLVELQYNRTWIRLVTERNQQVYPPIVVMHIDYLKIPRDAISSLPSDKLNETVMYLSDRNGPIQKSAVIRSTLTKQIFDGVMQRSFRSRDKANSMAFCECPPINGPDLLQMLLTCQQLNQREPLQLILILFQDNRRFVECLSKLVSRL